MKQFKHLSGLLKRVVSPMQEHHKQARATVHASSWIRTHDPSQKPNFLNVSQISFVV
jgi:hypothetical protein